MLRANSSSTALHSAPESLSSLNRQQTLLLFLLKAPQSVSCCYTQTRSITLRNQVKRHRNVYYERRQATLSRKQW